MEITFHRNPGLYYDLYNLLIMKLNIKAKWVRHVANAGHETKDIQYIESYMKQFPDPEPELAVFFYLKSRKASSYFLEVYKEELQKNPETICLGHFLQHFSDIEKVKQEICSFYFGNQVNAQNISEMSRVIEADTSICNEKIKFYLLSFFARPQHFVDSLKSIFQEYDIRLQSLYDEHQKVIDNLKREIDVKQIKQGTESKTGKALAEHDILNVSFVVINKNVVYIQKNNYIVGIDSSISIQNELNLQVNPASFGNAFGDATRVRIIQHLLREGELSSGEMAKRLGVALNTVTYHLELMTRAHLLCSRMQGKTTYYWLDIRACEKAADMLDKWIETGGNQYEGMEKAHHRGRKRKGAAGNR